MASVTCDIPASLLAELMRRIRIDGGSVSSLVSETLAGYLDSPLHTLFQVYVMDVPRYPRPILIMDAAVNLVSSLADKRDIVQNAINFAYVPGVEEPRVAALAPVEVVNSKLQTTLDEAALSKMVERGQITGGLVDGPLAFDNGICRPSRQWRNW